MTHKIWKVKHKILKIICMYNIIVKLDKFIALHLKIGNLTLR